MPDDSDLSADVRLWQRYNDDEQRLTAPVSERMLELAALQSGQRVLDIASGRGEPALRAAEKVGPAGCVWATDVSAPMLQMAQALAAQRGLAHMRWKTVDAQTLDGVPLQHFDVTLARWGLMYMDDPVAALKAIRRCLRPGGVLVAAFWAEPERVPYFSLPRDVLERHLWPQDPAVPRDAVGEPGTFAYASPDRIHADLVGAGFAVEVLEEMDIPVMEAHSDADLIAWVRAFTLNRFIQGLGLAQQRAWAHDLLQAAQPWRSQGVVRLGGVTRLVRARVSLHVST